MREKTGGRTISSNPKYDGNDPTYPRQNFLDSKNNILPHQFVPEEEANQNKEEDAKTEKKRQEKIGALAAKVLKDFSHLPGYVADEADEEREARKAEEKQVRKDLRHLPQGWGGKKSRNKRFRTKRKSKRRYR